MLAGFAGGFLGGAIFRASFVILPDALSRIIGIMILGFFIGLTISLLEEVLREAWLTVVWGKNETRNISLGSKPIIFGASSDADVYIPQFQKDVDPVMALIKIENSKVIMENKETNQIMELQDGSTATVGKLSVIVHTKEAQGIADAIKPVSSELYLFVKSYQLPLHAGQELFACHTGPGDDKTTVTGKIVTSKKDPGKIALRNLSGDKWEYISSTNERAFVEPDGIIPLDVGNAKKDITINFNGITGRIAVK
jgi:hypothetical protein